MTDTIGTTEFYEYAKSQGFDADQVMRTIGEIIRKYPELVEHDEQGKPVTDLDKLIHIARTERAMMEQEASGLDDETFLKNMIKSQIQELKDQGHKPLQAYKILKEKAKRSSAQAVTHAEARTKDREQAIDIVVGGAEHYLDNVRAGIEEVYGCRFKTKRKSKC